MHVLKPAAALVLIGITLTGPLGPHHEHEPPTPYPVDIVLQPTTQHASSSADPRSQSSTLYWNGHRLVR